MNGRNNGYEFTLDTRRNILKLRVWGLWDVELAREYLQTREKKIKEISAGGKEWYLLADLTNRPPQTEEVQKIIRDGLALSKQYGVKKVARLVKNPITRLQIERLTREIDMLFGEHGSSEVGYFQSEDEAIQWLLRK